MADEGIEFLEGRELPDGATISNMMLPNGKAGIKDKLKSLGRWMLGITTKNRQGCTLYITEYLYRLEQGGPRGGSRDPRGRRGQHSLHHLDDAGTNVQNPHDNVKTKYTAYRQK